MNKNLIDAACEKAKQYVAQGKPWPLAIHLASQDFDLSTATISGEFKARREARKNAKKKYESTLPDYVLKGKDWE